MDYPSSEIVKLYAFPKRNITLLTEATNKKVVQFNCILCRNGFSFTCLYFYGKFIICSI